MKPLLLSLLLLLAGCGPSGDDSGGPGAGEDDSGGPGSGLNDDGTISE